MNRGIGIALVLAGCMLAIPAQGQQANSGPAQDKGKQAQQSPQQAPQQPNPQKDANPFPTDTTDVPVLPSRENPTPAAPPNGSYSNTEQVEDAHYPLQSDNDPVASPDEAIAGENSDGQMSSSSVKSLDSILPPPDVEEPGKKGKKGGEIEGAPKESAAQDINVAKYYLDNKNWRAALSRYQSAMVLAPEDPEVYWGLAVSQHHMGDYAAARTNYEKVIEYDPDSKHAKEAKKALKEPELANAKPAHPAGAQQQ
jgi:tetratricopeptide (TPR) repeat protein